MPHLCIVMHTNTADVLVEMWLVRLH